MNQYKATEIFPLYFLMTTIPNSLINKQDIQFFTLLQKIKRIITNY